MKRIAIIFALIFAFGLGTIIPSTVSAAQDRPLKIWYENSNGMMDTYCVVDENTGVNYIVVSSELHGEPGGVTVTPRLNADGSLYITP